VFRVYLGGFGFVLGVFCVYAYIVTRMAQMGLKMDECKPLPAARCCLAMRYS
jgi:hypothetical protein